uniref:Uncharacterized protein n=1 Tax=Cucumis melo TaxID=3656 RepID=A0A9I9E839_CUCME
MTFLQNKAKKNKPLNDLSVQQTLYVSVMKTNLVNKSTRPRHTSSISFPSKTNSSFTFSDWVMETPSSISTFLT